MAEPPATVSGRAGSLRIVILPGGCDVFVWHKEEYTYAAGWNASSSVVAIADEEIRYSMPRLDNSLGDRSNFIWIICVRCIRGRRL